MRSKHLVAAISTSVLLALGGLAPAYAAGGPPVLSAPSPSPVASDGILTVSGTSCAAGSPVSLYLWDTSGGPYVYYHHTTSGGSTGTGWTADGSGAFTRPIPLEDRFHAGSEVGVAASCTTVFEPPVGVEGNPRFVQVTLPTPFVEIVVPARAGYGALVKARVTTSDANGVVVLALPGHADQVAGTQWGPTDFVLPRTLGVGSHTLTATFDPTVDGAPTVTDTATLVITKASSRTTLTRVGTGAIRAGKRVRLKIVLTSTGPRTGTVVIRDGRRVRRTVVVRASDNGRKAIWVRLPVSGVRVLTARYAGNSRTLASVSPRVRVTVRR